MALSNYVKEICGFDHVSKFNDANWEQGKLASAREFGVSIGRISQSVST
jgi:hypothetical protein